MRIDNHCPTTVLYWIKVLFTTVNFLIHKIISKLFNCFGGVDRNRCRNLSVLKGSWRYQGPFV